MKSRCVQGWLLSVILVLLLRCARSAASSSSGNIFSSLLSPESLMGSGPRERAAPVGTSHGFSDQSNYVGLKSSGVVVAVGDFNGDRFIDLLMLDSSSLRAFGAMLWDHDEFAFRHASTPVSLDDPALKSVEQAAGVRPLGKITAAYVADFGNDGFLDVLVSDGFQGRLFFGDGAGRFNASRPVVVPQLPRVAALVDANGDFIPEVFVVFNNNTRGFWQFQRNVAETDDRFNQTGDMHFIPWPTASHQDASGKECKVADEMAAGIAFADMDGDCLPDLVVPTSCGVEVWSNDATSGQAFWNLTAARSKEDMMLLQTDIYNFAHGDRALLVADFDSDGTLDLAVANRNRKDLRIYRNVQKKRSVGELCSRDPDWALEERIGVAKDFDLHKPRLGNIISAIDILPLMHSGDYDLDGMPDILLIDGRSTSPVIYRNKGIWNTKRKNEENFERLEASEQSGLSKGNDGAISAMFFDIDESGRQDILVVRSGNQTRLMWNTIHEGWDALFFKGTMLSALGYRLDPRPFAPVVGNTIKVSYMERGTRIRTRRVCSQCAHSGAFQLQNCNCHFGLKGIANYIEELSAGGGSASRSWTSLMPNSMAVIWSEGGSSGKGSWWMEYFTQRRGSQMLRVTAVLVAALAVLGILILWLQQREVKEDRERDDRESSRLFNFVV